MDAISIDHVNIRIPEDRVDDALQFYQDVLGFEPVKLDRYRAGERTSFAFQVSDVAMIHIRPIAGFEEPGEHNFDHFCILLDEEIDTIKERLDEHDVPIRREGTPWGPTGRAPAVYIADPFGYVIELKSAPNQ